MRARASIKCACRVGRCVRRCRPSTPCVVTRRYSVRVSCVRACQRPPPFRRVRAEGIIFFFSVCIFVAFTTLVNDVHGQWLQVLRAAAVACQFALSHTRPVVCAEQCPEQRSYWSGAATAVCVLAKGVYVHDENASVPLMCVPVWHWWRRMCWRWSMRVHARPRALSHFSVGARRTIPSCKRRERDCDGRLRVRARDMLMLCRGNMGDLALWLPNVLVPQLWPTTLYNGAATPRGFQYACMRRHARSTLTVVCVCSRATAHCGLLAAPHRQRPAAANARPQ